jgi:hypothetical protein
MVSGASIYKVNGSETDAVMTDFFLKISDLIVTYEEKINNL